MAEFIHKSHNVSVLLYHLVCACKYRRVVIDSEVEQVIREVCQEIEKRYEIRFIEIGMEKDHVHFLIQSVPTYSPTKLANIIKSIIARKVFAKVPELKHMLWGGEFWGAGYYRSTVGAHADGETIQNYVKNQGQQAEYNQLYRQQIKLDLL